MELSEAFLKEHELIRRAILVLRGMIRDAENGVLAEKHDVNALLMFLHYFGDACHQAKEEKILFPLLKQAQISPKVDSNIRQQLEHLLSEHHDDRLLIEKAQFDLFADSLSNFIFSAKKLAQMLSDHARKEEQMLFPIVEQVISEQQAEEALARIEQADADFGCSQRSLLFDLLRELEAKYQQKAA